MMDVDENGYLAVPQSGGPGVLVLHAWWGLNPFFKHLCDRLAREGFVAFAPDLYRGKTATSVEEAEQLRSKLNRRQVGQDVAAAVEHLRGLEAVRGAGVGVIGFSLGANLALELSLEKAAEVAAVVLFYGTRGGDYSLARAVYQGHFAERDDWVASSGVKALEKNLRRAGREMVFYTYEGTGHWFFEEDRVEAYNSEAAGLAWERTVEFLRGALVK